MWLSLYLYKFMLTLCIFSWVECECTFFNLKYVSTHLRSILGQHLSEFIVTECLKI